MILKISQDSPLIGYANEGDAGIDLVALGFVVDLDSEKKELSEDFYDLKPNERILVKTGVKAQIPKGYWGNIRDRSGLALKHGIHTLGGVIDETYRGEIGVILVNLSSKTYRISKGDRIAQMIISSYERVDIVKDQLDDTSRGAKGFGSTGN